MYGTTELRKGTKVELDGEPYIVVESQFVKPGKGNAFTRCRLKSLVSGNVIDRTWKSGERIKKAQLEDLPMQFLYADGDQYNFMNTQTYDQIAIAKDNLGDAPLYLLEQMEVAVLFHNGQPLSVELPNFVVLEITHADPGVKGNTATGATKPVTLETGAEVYVPLFVEQGEKVKVDTRTGEYVERAK